MDNYLEAGADARDALLDSFVTTGATGAPGAPGGTGAPGGDVEVPTDWDDVAAQVLPVLRPAMHAQGPGRATPLAREFQPLLNEMVVVDLPDVMAYVNIEQVHDWGVSDADVFDRARANLAARAQLPATEERPAQPTAIRLVESGDDYWASHLLLDGWLAAMADQVGGWPVALLPDADSVLILPAEDPALLGEWLESIEQEYLAAEQPVSPQAYTVDETGRVVPLSVPVDHPLWNPVHRSTVVFASRTYKAQADSYVDDDLVESYVGSLLVADRPDGGVHSVAVWGEGVDALLPEADYIAFAFEDGEHFAVPWEVAATATGLAPAPGWQPVRYRVRSWPVPSVIERLRAAAVPL